MAKTRSLYAAANTFALRPEQARHALYEATKRSSRRRKLQSLQTRISQQPQRFLDQKSLQLLSCQRAPARFTADNFSTSKCKTESLGRFKVRPPNPRQKLCRSPCPRGATAAAAELQAQITREDGSKAAVVEKQARPRRLRPPPQRTRRSTQKSRARRTGSPT